MPDNPESKNDRLQQTRPILLLLTSHWLSLLGVALVTTAGFSWLFVLPLHMRGSTENPYIGLLVFLAIPVVFFAGLALIPVGIFLAKKRVAAGILPVENRRAALQRIALFFGALTVVNIVIGTQVTYRAVQHMESNQFCGATCHVMKPEFTAHLKGPHQNVACTECHVTPGATGFVKSKIAGSRQMLEVALNTHPRPVPAALESDRLAPSVDTCEGCHSRSRVVGQRLRLISKFKDDETNTPTQTALLMNVGGGMTGGIHGVHMGPGVVLRYATPDGKRDTIPWVEYSNTNTKETRTYLAAGTKPESVAGMKQFEMQCVDCHNRPTHNFDLPEAAVDKAMASGEIPTGLPFAKKTAVELLKANYATDDEAISKIPTAFAAFYQQKYPDLRSKRSNDIDHAGQAILALYQRNVFPDLKVTWGTYPDNLGHMDSPGCFRCHDESHTNAAKKTITQDCSACHNPLAVDETNPEILKTLGLADKMAGLQTH